MRDSAENQLRLDICERTNREFYPVGTFPEFRSAMSAANWLRHSGHPGLSQQSFKGLVQDITGRTMSDEEFDIVRVLTGVAANLDEENYYFSKFATEEEADHVGHMVRAGEIPEDKNIIITKTILGWYIQVLPVINED